MYLLFILAAFISTPQSTLAQDSLKTDLALFEGYYQLRQNKDARLQIRAKANGLMLTQIWDSREIFFSLQSSLTFQSKENPAFTLLFTKNKSGTVTQLLAFNKDVWDKSTDSVPSAINTPNAIEKVGTYKELTELLKKKLSELSRNDVFSGAVLLAKGNKILFEYACGDAIKPDHIKHHKYEV